MSNGFNNRPNIPQSLLDNAASNFSGILSTRPSAKYSSGARTILKINGKIVGFAFAVSWRISTTYAEINTVDDPLPNEFVPQRLAVEGSISALHIPGISATTENWQPDVLSFLFGQYIQIEVRDSSDNLLFLTRKAVIVSRTEDVKVDQLSSVTLQFKAIGWRDEKTPEYPDGITSASPDSNSQLKGTTLPARLERSAEDIANDPVNTIKNLIG
jgi:hypothetical protein